MSKAPKASWDDAVAAIRAEHEAERDEIVKRKLTPTERAHEIMLAALHRTPVKASEAVDLTRNAKGDWQFTVAGVAGEEETLAKVSARVLSVARSLDDQLPLSRAQIFGRDYLPNEKGTK